MSVPVQYDFGTANELVSLLTALNTKLTDLASTRAQQRSADLGDPSAPTATTWTGGKRRDFEDQFGREQAALTDLAATVLTVRGQVQDATTLAQKMRNGKV